MRDLPCVTQSSFVSGRYPRTSGPFTLLGAAVGAMEEFFRKMSTLTKPPTPEEAQKIHLAHAMKVVGPPLSL
jgi:hypothetical protein